MTPDQFQSDAVQWAAAAGSTIGAVIAVFALVLPKIAALKAQVDTLFSLHTESAKEIANNARALPPPTITQTPDPKQTP